MPDRYGDEPMADWERELLRINEVAHCELCDDNGMRGMFLCDHVDHAAAAKRGKAMCEEALEKARKSRLASTQSHEKANRVVGGGGGQ